MRKGKVGDIVKATRSDSPYYHFGEVGEVLSTDSQGDYWVKFPSNLSHPRGVCIMPENCELVEETAGLKYDREKPMWHLIPMDCVSGVVKVMTFGAKKYKPNSWQGVGAERYYSAGMRHLEAIAGGEELDSESNLHHAFHYLCNQIFITWALVRGDNQWVKKIFGTT